MRKIIQIAPEPKGDGTSLALCDDGTLWRLRPSGDWYKIPPVPQEASREDIPKVHLNVEGRLYEVLGSGQVRRGNHYLVTDCSAVIVAARDRDYHRVLLKPLPTLDDL